MNLFWGDLHNHCAVSYGEGTPQRALDNARQHLDFCTLTGHAFWPDMPLDLAKQNRIIGMHLGGFAKLQHYWPELMAILREANQPGKFVTLPSYEWHSMKYGDHNCYFADFGAELIDAPELGDLEEKLRQSGREFMMLPHHCAYTRGFRGVNWDHFSARRSPLVEIYSNHGCGESDDAPYEYHHSMGPRVGESMVRTGLLAGHRFGFYASTDTHDGYPGHYGHGVAGVLADRLEVGSIWRSLRERRTIASTGARMHVRASLGGADIGQVAAHASKLPLSLEVEGTAPIERVDLVEGAGGVAHVRRLPGPSLQTRFSPGRHKLKLECGWGRGNELSDWNVRVRLRGARLLGVQPCFRYSGYRPDDAGSTEKLMAQTETSLEWTCRASANPTGMIGGTHFNAGGTQALVLDLEAGAEAGIRVDANGVEIDVPLSRLSEGSVGRQVAGFGSSAVKLHRLVPPSEFSFRFEDPDYAPPGESGFVYFRILQADGQVVWVSPMWWE